jgi:hypothetical protein
MDDGPYSHTSTSRLLELIVARSEAIGRGEHGTAEAFEQELSDREALIAELKFRITDDR